MSEHTPEPFADRDGRELLSSVLHSMRESGITCRMDEEHLTVEFVVPDGVPDATALDIMRRVFMVLNAAHRDMGGSGITVKAVSTDPSRNP